MKLLTTAVLGALTLAVAAPALAQPSGWDIDRREHWLDDRIDRGLADGSLDHKEAHKVHDKLREVRDLEGRMRMRDGGRLNDPDRMVLEDKLDNIARQIHWMKADNERAPWWR